MKRLFLVGLVALIVLVAFPASVSAADPVDVDVSAQLVDTFEFSVADLQTGLWELHVGANANDGYPLASFGIDTSNNDDTWHIVVTAQEQVSGYAALRDTTETRYLDSIMYGNDDGAAWSGVADRILASGKEIFSGTGTNADAGTFYLCQPVTSADFEAGTDLVYQNTLTFTATLGV